MTGLLLIFFGAAYLNNLALIAFFDRRQKIATTAEPGMLIASALLLALATVLQLFPQSSAISKDARVYVDVLAFATVAVVLARAGSMAAMPTIPLGRARVWLPLLVANLTVLSFVLLDEPKARSVLLATRVCLAASAATSLALILWPALHERIETAEVPRALRGTSITLLSSAIVSLALIGVVVSLPW